MKTIEIDGNKIEISDESFEALKKQLVKPKSWKPSVGEECYHLESDGVAVFRCRDGTDTLCEWNQGNVFETADEAYFEADKRALLHEIKVWNEENDNIVDWSDGNWKSTVYFNNGTNKLKASKCTGAPPVIIGAYYFKTYELAEKFLKDFDHDKLKKYLFNVKE